LSVCLEGNVRPGTYPGYAVNALIENRHRILLGLGPEIFRSSASENHGLPQPAAPSEAPLWLPAHAPRGRQGFFAAAFIEALLTRGIAPHIAVDRGRQRAHTCVRMRRRSLGYQLSQRCRKQIEELFGEGGKDWHGLRRFRRRGLDRVKRRT